MASLKEVKNRISSVKSTRQITSAMKMVASAKLHKAQDRVLSMYPYQQKLNEILVNFMGNDLSVQSPYTEVRPVTKVAVLAFSSNSSLCGAFNLNVVKTLERTLDEYRSLKKEDVLIYPVGRKIEETVRKMGYTPQGSYQAMADKPSFTEAYKLAGQLMDEFAAGHVDRVELIYHHFKSMGTQVLTREPFLPIDLNKIRQEVQKNIAENVKDFPTYNQDYIVEPSAEELIVALHPRCCARRYSPYFRTPMPRNTPPGPSPCRRLRTTPTS